MPQTSRTWATSRHLIRRCRYLLRLPRTALTPFDKLRVSGELQ